MPNTQSQTDMAEDLRIIFGLMEDRTELKEAALADLLRRHGGTIKGMVWKKFANALQKEEVHDVLLRTATKAWRYAASFDDEKASLQTWLVAIAIREAKDVIREKTWEFNSVEDDDVIEPYFFDGAESEADVEKQESKLILDFRTVIESLPELQRAIIDADLACGETADAERLAEIHATTKNSIYVSRAKAKKRIEVEMTRLGHFPPTGSER